MKPLILGESPSKTGDKFFMFPLSGAVAERICKLASIPPQEKGSRYGVWTWALYDLFDCDNVFERHYEAVPWVRPLARKNAREICDGYEVVVALGRKVQEAIGMEDYDFHVWADQTKYGYKSVAIPHPSGLNRVLNAEEERQKFGNSIQQALTISLGSTII